MFWLVALGALAFILYFSLCLISFKRGYREGYIFGHKVGLEIGELDFQDQLEEAEEEKKVARRANLQKATHLKLIK